MKLNKPGKEHTKYFIHRSEVYTDILELKNEMLDIIGMFGLDPIETEYEFDEVLEKYEPEVTPTFREYFGDKGPVD